MKRLWIGIVILVLLVIVGVTMLLLSQDFCRKFSASMEAAGVLALEENWPAAREKMQEGQQLWCQYHRFWSASTDHEPVEQMQNLFSQLEVYEQYRWEVDFSTVCRNLVHLAEAIDESHNLKWWSIL